MGAPYSQVVVYRDSCNDNVVGLAVNAAFACDVCKVTCCEAHVSRYTQKLFYHSLTNTSTPSFDQYTLRCYRKLPIDRNLSLHSRNLDDRDDQHEQQHEHVPQHHNTTAHSP